MLIFCFTNNRTSDSRHASISFDDSTDDYTEQQITPPIGLQMPQSPTIKLEMTNSNGAESSPQTKAPSYMPKNQLPKVSLEYCTLLLCSILCYIDIKII